MLQDIFYRGVAVTKSIPSYGKLQRRYPGIIGIKDIKPLAGLSDITLWFVFGLPSIHAYFTPI
jgi:hypothetical protein